MDQRDNNLLDQPTWKKSKSGDTGLREQASIDSPTQVPTSAICGDTLTCGAASLLY
jgi:hypothetical protein